MVNEQPKLVDSEVADIPLDDGLNGELGAPQEVKEKPSYVTRAVAARQRGVQTWVLSPNHESSEEWRCVLMM